MDATALGTLLVGVGAVIGAAVTYTGKRSETAVTGLNSLADQLQEERMDLRAQVVERDAVIAGLRRQVSEQDARAAGESALRAADQAEIARLRNEIAQRGGGP